MNYPKIDYDAPIVRAFEQLQTSLLAKALHFALQRAPFAKRDA
jgi:hypothetical protein